MLTFKEYLIEEDRITAKLDAIQCSLEDTDEKEVADTPAKQDRKWNIDKQRYSKMHRKLRNQPTSDGYGDSEHGNPEGMKTSGGPGFSG